MFLQINACSVSEVLEFSYFTRTEQKENNWHFGLVSKILQSLLLHPRGSYIYRKDNITVKNRKYFLVSVFCLNVMSRGCRFDVTVRKTQQSHNTIYQNQKASFFVFKKCDKCTFYRYLLSFRSIFSHW